MGAVTLFVIKISGENTGQKSIDYVFANKWEMESSECIHSIKHGATNERKTENFILLTGCLINETIKELPYDN